MKRIKESSKRVAAVACSAVIGMSLFTGCGSKTITNDNKISINETNEEDETSKAIDDEQNTSYDSDIAEVLANMVMSVSDIDSLEIDCDGSTTINISEGSDKSVEAIGDAGIEAILTGDPMSGHLNVDVSYSLAADNVSQKVSNTYEMYMEQDGNEEKLYTKENDNEWEVSSEKISTDYQDIQKEVDNQDKKELEKTIKEAFDEEGVDEIINMSKSTKKVNNKNCYEISFDFDDDIIDSLISSGIIDDSQFNGWYEQCDLLDISIKLYVDTKTYYPVQLAAEGKLKMESDGMDISVELPTTELNITVNEAKEVKVPDSVKKNAVESKDGILGDSSGLDEYSNISDLFGEEKSDSDEYDSETTTKKEDSLDEEETTKSTAGKTTSSISDIVKINNKEIKLGCKLKDLLDMGFIIDDKYGIALDSDVEAEDSEVVFITDKDETEISISVTNNFSSTVKLDDCIVNGIIVQDLSNMINNADVVVADGVKLGMKQADAEKILSKYEIEDTYEYSNVNEVDYGSYDDNLLEVKYDSTTKKIIGFSLYKFED